MHGRIVRPIKTKSWYAGKIRHISPLVVGPRGRPRASVNRASLHTGHVQRSRRGWRASIARSGAARPAEARRCCPGRADHRVPTATTRTASATHLCMHRQRKEENRCGNDGTAHMELLSTETAGPILRPTLIRMRADGAGFQVLSRSFHAKPPETALFRWPAFPQARGCAITVQPWEALRSNSRERVSQRQPCLRTR